MTFRHIDTELDLAEAYAEECGHWAISEEAVSEKFDEEIAPFVIGKYGEDDIAMSEAFNDWTDALTKDYELHREQYANYCYVGEYS